MNTTCEIWKPICETNGKYEVSNMGRIRNSQNGYIRKPHFLPNGYVYVYYNLFGKRNRRYMHRLVADAFCKHPEGFDTVNHIDNNKLNNTAENLEWTTQLSNVHHGMQQKRYRLNAIPVIGYKDGFAFRFSSMHVAGKQIGCDDRGIARCCDGVYKMYKGYKWEYAKEVK